MRADDFLVAEDVALILGIGKNKVYQLAKEGALASYHIGRKLRFTREDVQAYLASQKSHGAEDIARTNDSDAPARSIDDAASALKPSEEPFLLEGDSNALDLLGHALADRGFPVKCVNACDYAALVDLYTGAADIVAISLYDQRENSFNTPYIRALAPGKSVCSIRSHATRAGFVVSAGNPKRISSWGALLREGVVVAPSPLGTSARVLLDEKLSAMEARGSQINGYDRASISEIEAINRVAEGLADVCIVHEDSLSDTQNIEFIPLIKTSEDIVIAKTERTRQLLRTVKSILTSDSHKKTMAKLGDYDVHNMGAVAYES